MSAPKRLPPWHEHFRLPSGRELLIRPIRPEDAGPIQGAFGLLGPEEIRHRFLYDLKELSPEMAQRLTHTDPNTEFAWSPPSRCPPAKRWSARSRARRWCRARATPSSPSW